MELDEMIHNNSSHLESKFSARAQRHCPKGAYRQDARNDASNDFCSLHHSKQTRPKNARRIFLTVAKSKTRIAPRSSRPV